MKAKNAVSTVQEDSRRKSGKNASPYAKFLQIDGSHPLRHAVPNSCVEYRVRSRHNGKVAYFNFNLAREMGLIPADHPPVLTPELSQAVLQTFALQIINEYDILHKVKVPEADIRPNTYMATRYLQLQHPDKRGTTSGDGRSIWNGQVSHDGVTWDLSSCGTGATCLSPATAIEKKFFKTGSRTASYGCGLSTVDEGLGAALMSEIFHQNGIQTERTLCIVEFPRGQSVNVRAGRNLIRPSHLFHHLRQGNVTGLRAAVDYYIGRQKGNGDWTRRSGNAKHINQYLELAERVASDFGKAAARFESEYMFVWLDWDGDNILADGGIIDYGSVRQFGLFHHEYRYDDIQRWSTNIKEQRLKARILVETFAQIADYLSTGKQRPRTAYRDSAPAQLFDRTFEEWMTRLLLEKQGFQRKQAEHLLAEHPELCASFRRVHSYFERAQSAKGIHKVSDGITADAVYCTRDIARELPLFLFMRKTRPSHALFLKTMASDYATDEDRKVTPERARKIDRYLDLYTQLVDAAAHGDKVDRERLLMEVAMRSAVINKRNRITGNAAIFVTQEIINAKKKLSFAEQQEIIQGLIADQCALPEAKKNLAFDGPAAVSQPQAKKIFSNLLKIVETYRDTI